MKPTVHYDASKSSFITVGAPASVFPLDHPSPHVRNTREAITSRVIRKEDDGTFETQNTIYVPRKD